MSTFFELLLESIPSFNTHKKQSYVQNNVEGGDIVWLIKIIIQTLNNKIVAHLLRSKVAPLIQRMRAKLLVNIKMLNLFLNPSVQEEMVLEERMENNLS